MLPVVLKPAAGCADNQDSTSPTVDAGIDHHRVAVTSQAHIGFVAGCGAAPSDGPPSSRAPGGSLAASIHFFALASAAGSFGGLLCVPGRGPGTTVGAEVVTSIVAEGAGETNVGGMGPGEAAQAVSRSSAGPASSTDPTAVAFAPIPTSAHMLPLPARPHPEPSRDRDRGPYSGA